MVRLLTPTANTSTTVQARSRLVIAAEIGRSCGQAARLCWRRLTMPSLRSVRQCFRVRSTTKTIQEVSFFALTVPLGAHREGEIAVRVRFGFPSPWKCAPQSLDRARLCRASEKEFFFRASRARERPAAPFWRPAIRFWKRRETFGGFRREHPLTVKNGGGSQSAAAKSPLALARATRQTIQALQ